MKEYFIRLFTKLGTEPGPPLMYYLSTKDGQRARRLAKLKTRRGAKNRRNKRKFDRLNEEILVAKKELLTRMGTYKSGINLDIGDWKNTKA